MGNVVENEEMGYGLQHIYLDKFILMQPFGTKDILIFIFIVNSLKETEL